MQVAAFRRAFARLRGARDGNVAILFAFLSLPILGFTGAAIDYGLATRLEVKLQAATDATALALCQTPLSTTKAALQLQAGTMMTGFMGATVTLDAITITDNPRQITLTARAPSPIFFGKITGTTTIRPRATARCATPLPKTFEIALVLDNTGSMNVSGGGQTKMQALKTAAANFVDYVYSNDAFSAGTRLSIVPFASAVAIPASYRSASWIDLTGKSSYHWTNVLSPGGSNFTNRLQIFAKLQGVYAGWGWAGCLETLPYPLNIQDMTPSSNDSYFVPMLAPDEPGDSSATYACVGQNCSYNSYIDDKTDKTNCDTTNNLTFAQLEGRACKYVSPTGATPTNSNYFTGVPNGPNFGCTTQPLQTLTSDTAALKALINSMAPLGSTNIYEGLMWGWRTLSPLSVFAGGASPPASYSSSAVNKVLILMTDGENSWPMNGNSPYNQSMYFPAGYIKNADGSGPNPRLPPGNQNISTTSRARNALDALTSLACSNAKAAGISIYTIGFSVPADPIDQQGLNLLSSCASATNQFFVANDANGLITAFNQIASSIGSLRLTQ
ncbi:pilus assembly protein TadG-related protein [Methylobacterium radiodurans]|uniref:von willebrand factor type a n=1 Tax=Methylobacterium radiodurans TaxID=2202828 RepID=A0A2U8VMD6_9HYPH|nr:pilus assembly protein TadG-related protein [Methylobacterium radiodurans]AWN34737.1 von willebrand factor type a [Methylobacterium radiodurans]